MSDIPVPSQHEVTREVADVPLRFPARRAWWIAFGIALALLSLFVVSVVHLLMNGPGIWGNNMPVNWGFPIFVYVWWLGLGHAGTLISALLLLLGQEWRNALNRFAEAMTLCAVICAGIYPIIHLGRPWFLYWMFPYPATMGVWPQFRSPLEWDIWAVMTYLIVSAIFWYIGLVPDLATMRDRARSLAKKRIYGLFALGWRGQAIHWLRWKKLYRLMAAIAVPLVVSVHSEVSLLFAAGQIPGWHSTIYPPYFVLGAAFSGFAIVSMIAIVVRRAFHLEALVTNRHLDLLGKVLLASGLMTAYGYVFEAFDALYSGDAHEIGTLMDRVGGVYLWSYWGAIILNFLPLQGLWFARVRNSPLLLFLISASVMIGMWMERYMLLVTSLYQDFLPSSFGRYTPTFWDWSTYIGTLGLFLTPFLLFLRFIPSISMFEEKEIADG